MAAKREVQGESAARRLYSEPELEQNDPEFKLAVLPVDEGATALKSVKLSGQARRRGDQAEGGVRRRGGHRSRPPPPRPQKLNLAAHLGGLPCPLRRRWQGSRRRHWWRGLWRGRHRRRGLGPGRWWRRYDWRERGARERCSADGLAVPCRRG